MTREFPEELRKLKRWVGSRTDSKIPCKCLPSNNEFESASTADESTWCDYETACVGLSLGFVDYLGFVFCEQDGYVAIDIDTGKDEFDLPSDLAIDIIEHCKSYTEESKSGRGYHIILKGKLSFKGKNNRNGVEIYKTGRYFIMTGKNKFYYDIIENQAAIDYVVETYFKEFRDNNNTEKHERFYSPIYEKPKGSKISLKPIYPDIPKGCRNQSMLSLAGQFKHQNYTKGETYKKLLEINQIACKPPLSANEIEMVIESCYKYKN